MVKKCKSIHSWISAHWRHTDSKLRTILSDLIGLYTKRVYCKTNIPSVIMLSLPKIPFAASHSRGTKPPCWRAKVAVGQDKQKTYIIWNGNFLCLSCPSATFALQHGSFVPREWLAAKAYSYTSLIKQLATVISLLHYLYFWESSLSWMLQISIQPHFLAVK